MNNPPLLPLDLDLVIKDFSKLPSPSVVLIELLHAIDSEDTSPADLAKYISRDQGLVVRTLRIANSSFYGMSKQVENISDAITILGSRTLRSVVVTTALFNNFSSVLVPGFDLEGFWRHSIATAISARILAQRVNQKEGSAFIAGLLHDIGRLVLASSFPDHEATVIRYQKENNCFMNEAERAILGFDHAQIGGLLVGRWHFPSIICDAIAHHHRPVDSGNGSAAGTVHLGDALAHALDLSNNPAEMVPCISQPCWNQLNMIWRDSQNIFAEVEREFKALSQATLS